MPLLIESNWVLLLPSKITGADDEASSVMSSLRAMGVEKEMVVDELQVKVTVPPAPAELMSSWRSLSLAGHTPAARAAGDPTAESAPLTTSITMDARAAMPPKRVQYRSRDSLLLPP